MINSMLIHRIFQKASCFFFSYLVLKDSTCSYTASNSAHDLEQIGLFRVCTLDSIDSIKSLKRSPQHIFVEVRVPGFQVPSSGVQFPCSEFRVPG
ncbi:hypothetical protein Avbf_16068 [Armadillidium vulgare]|nr:hypothetical protein Avbf_16068 [Armadillidium vulgare]